MINSNILKLIAIMTMLIDHIGFVFFPSFSLLYYIGRISFPIFAYLISYSFFISNHKRDFLIKLLLFAFVSEIFYDFVFYNSLTLYYQNIFFEYFIVLFFYLIYLKIKELFKNEKSYDLIIIYIFLGIIAGVASEKLHFCYGLFGVVLMWFGIGMEEYSFDKKIFILLLILVLLFNNIDFLIQCLVFILCYFLGNRRGKKSRKWEWYIYPAHLFLLFFIKIVLGWMRWRRDKKLHFMKNTKLYWIFFICKNKEKNRGYFLFFSGWEGMKKWGDVPHLFLKFFFIKQNPFKSHTSYMML